MLCCQSEQSHIILVERGNCGELGTGIECNGSAALICTRTLVRSECRGERANVACGTTRIHYSAVPQVGHSERINGAGGLL